MHATAALMQTAGRCRTCLVIYYSAFAGTHTAFTDYKFIVGNDIVCVCCLATGACDAISTVLQSRADCSPLSGRMYEKFKASYCLIDRKHRISLLSSSREYE